MDEIQASTFKLQEN